MGTGIIIDLFVLIIIALSVFISARYGFVRTLIEVIGFVAALILVFSVSTPLANITYDKLIEPTVVNAALKAADDQSKNTVDAVWSSLPSFITKNSDSLGLKKDSIEQKISDTASQGAAKAASVASQSIARPIITKILSMIFSTVLMIVLLFVVKIAAKYINKLFSFSIVGKLNRNLGGIIGLFKGVIIAIAFCMVLSLIISFTGNGIWVFTKENFESSATFKITAILQNRFL